MKIKRLTFSLSLIFLFLFSGSVYGDDLDDGVDAAKKGDYKTAYKLWLPLAEQRNAIAQFNLGAMYDQGKGVFQNVMRAFNWYKLSAEQGYLKAQFKLGEIYREGEFVTRNFRKALN
jgi:TPR repeat protein